MMTVRWYPWAFWKTCRQGKRAWCAPETQPSPKSLGPRRIIVGQTVKITVIALILAIGLMVSGCARGFKVAPQTVTGTYQGVTGDGEAITVTMEEQGQAFRGHGIVDGEPVVLAGALSWNAVGSLTTSKGSSSIVSLNLSANNEKLTIQQKGQPAMGLVRGGTPIILSPGPFSGSYQAVQQGARLAEATIVQNGTLITGVGVILGDPAGITGKITAPRTAEGVLTFLDKSRLRFEIEQSEDGRTVTVRGLGTPVNLRKR
jgi:hypothetical protein